MEALRLKTVLDHSVSYLRFESGALNTDALGGLTWSTGAGTPTSAIGKFGGGVSFDTSSYITSADALGRAPFVNGWWVNAWVKDWTGAVFSAKAGGYENYCSLNSTNMALHLQTSTDVGKDANTVFPVGWDPTILNMLTWVAVSAGGTMHLKFYLNGVQFADTTYAGFDPGLCEAQSRIASYYIEGKNGTSGILDDLLLGANTIITDAEIVSLYRARGFPIAAII